MKSNTEGSLGPDRPNNALETTNPAQPVVVVHYRSRKKFLWVLVVFSFVVSICGILTYHRLVGRDLARAAEETQALLDSIQRDRIGAPMRAAVRPPPPPAMNP
jgi:hypothetical protein